MTEKIFFRPKELLRPLNNTLTIHTEDLLFLPRVRIFRDKDGYHLEIVTASRYVLAQDVCDELKTPETDGMEMLDIFQPADPVAGFETELFFHEDEIDKLIEFCKSVKDLKTSPGSIAVMEQLNSLTFTDEATGQELTLAMQEQYQEMGAQVTTNIALATTGLEDCGTKAYAVQPEFFARAKFLKREWDGVPFTFKFFENPRNGVTICVVKYGRLRLYVAGINLKTAFQSVQTSIGPAKVQECFWDNIS